MILKIDNVNIATRNTRDTGNNPRSIKTSTQILSTNITTNSTVFTFSVKKGSQFTVTLTPFLRSVSGAASVNIVHDGSTIGQVYMDDSATVTGSFSLNTPPRVATSGTVTITTSSFNSGDTLFGTGSTSATHATLYTYPDGHFDIDSNI